MTIAATRGKLRERFGSDGHVEYVDPREVAATALAQEVQDVPGTHRIWPTVTTLLGRFGFASLTDEAREVIERHLREANFDVYPSLRDVSSDETVCLSLPDDDPHSDSAITVRRLAGRTPAAHVLGQPVAPGSTLWVDIDVLKASREVLAQQLMKLEPRPPAELIEDVLHLDPFPRVASHAGGRFRSASCMAIKALEDDTAEGNGKTAGNLALQPVELLACDRWIISAWHQPKICGKNGEEHAAHEPVADRKEVVDTVLRRWAKQDLVSPGDIGVAIMFEIVCMYPDARRQLYVWHDRWEVDFYKYMSSDGDGSHPRPDCKTVVDLRALVSLFHQLVSPLDASRVRASTFWFPDAKAEHAERLDTSLDRSVVKLRELSDALRDDLDLIHLMLSREQADKTDLLQTSLQVVAAPFVAAAIVVGIYGANTWLPGKGNGLGFGIMVAATVLVAFVGYLLLTEYVNRNSAPSARR